MSIAAECLRPDTLHAWSASAAAGQSQVVALQRFLILATRDWAAAGFDTPPVSAALDDHQAAAAAISQMEAVLSVITRRVDAVLVGLPPISAESNTALIRAGPAVRIGLLLTGAIAALIQLLPPSALTGFSDSPGALKSSLRRAVATTRGALYEGLLTAEEASFQLRPLLAALHPAAAVARSAVDTPHLQLLARCNIGGEGTATKCRDNGAACDSAAPAISEEPFMQWVASSSPTAAALQTVRAAATRTVSANSVGDLAGGQLVTAAERQHALLSLVCPDMPLSEAVQAYLNTRNLGADAGDTEGEGTGARAGAALLDVASVAALLVNCKELSGGGPSKSATAVIGVYSTMSKVAHSCNPNCTFDGTASLMPLRQISAGEALSFSYVAMLGAAFRGTASRRRYILERRGFYCNCPRCTDPDPSTHGRAAPCATCGAPAFPLMKEGTATANGQWWCCIRCGGRMGPAEMTSVVNAEERLERALGALAADLDRCGAPLGDVAGGTALTAPPKNLFESLRQGLLDVLQKLGRFHWLYVYGCLQAARYFCLLAALPSSTAPTREAASSCAVAFTVHFCVGAQRQRLHRNAAAAVAAVLTDVGVLALRRAWTGPRRVEAALLIETARWWCPSWVRDSVLPPDYLQLAKDAPRLLYEQLRVTQQTQVAPSRTAAAAALPGSQVLPEPGRCVQLVAAATLGEEASAFTEWEQHLAARVSAYLQQQQQQRQQGLPSGVNGDAAQALMRRLMDAQMQGRR